MTTIPPQRYGCSFVAYPNDRGPVLVHSCWAISSGVTVLTSARSIDWHARSSTRPAPQGLGIVNGCGSCAGVVLGRGRQAASALRPLSVSRQTNQSGLIGLSNHGSARPFRMQLFTVRSLIFWPSRSNKGSLPPGCSRPRASQARWALLRLPRVCIFRSPRGRCGCSATTLLSLANFLIAAITFSTSADACCTCQSAES